MALIFPPSHLPACSRLTGSQLSPTTGPSPTAGPPITGRSIESQPTSTNLISILRRFGPLSFFKETAGSFPCRLSHNPSPCPVLLSLASRGRFLHYCLTVIVPLQTPQTPPFTESCSYPSPTNHMFWHYKIDLFSVTFKVEHRATTLKLCFLSKNYIVFDLNF